MSEKYKFHDPEGLYFVTCTVIDWIDLFTRKEYKHIIVDSLVYCQKNKGLIIHGWCLMPSHLHLIISADNGQLSGIMRDFKQYTSKQIIREISLINESRNTWMLETFSKAGKPLRRIKNYKVWQDGNHPIQLENNDFLDQKLDYVHDNPVMDGIVEEPEHYLYRSARDYGGFPGLHKVDLLV